MKPTMKLTAAVFAAVLVNGTVSAITIDVIPASAPNIYGSPSYTTWQANAIEAIRDGLSTNGDSSSPTFYQQAPSEMSVLDNIVTGFPSWLGQADPAVPFHQELGNRLLFGVNIKGEGQQISISNLSFTMVSTDPANSLNYTFGLGGYNYSAGYVGIRYGSNGVLGGGDDTYVTSGANTQLVDQIVGRGSGNAWAVYDDMPGATRQDKINLAAAGIATQPFTFTGTYTYQQPTGAAPVSGSARVTFIPTEAVPDSGSTSLLLGAALAGLAFAHSKRRRA